MTKLKGNIITLEVIFFLSKTTIVTCYIRLYLTTSKLHNIDKNMFLARCWTIFLKIVMFLSIEEPFNTHFSLYSLNLVNVIIIYDIWFLGGFLSH